MVIYIENVIFNNMVIDTLILYLASLLTRRRPLWWRIIISAILGTSYAVIAPLINFAGNFVLKILLSLIMCVIASNYRHFGEFLKFTAVFYGITFLIGGAVIGVSNLSSSIKFAINSPNNCYISLIILILLIITITVKAALRKLNCKNSKVFVKKVRIKQGGSEYDKIGYLDSGNTVYYKGLYPVVAMRDISGNPIGKLKVKTINSAEEMPLYRLGSVIIDDKIYRNVYAIAQKQNSEYDIILHSSML